MIIFYIFLLGAIQHLVKNIWGIRWIHRGSLTKLVSPSILASCLSYAEHPRLAGGDSVLPSSLAFTSVARSSAFDLNGVIAVAMTASVCPPDALFDPGNLANNRLKMMSLPQDEINWLSSVWSIENPMFSDLGIETLFGFPLEYQSSTFKIKVFNWLPHVETIDFRYRFWKKSTDYLLILFAFGILKINRVYAVWSVETASCLNHGPSKSTAGQ